MTMNKQEWLCGWRCSDIPIRAQTPIEIEHEFNCPEGTAIESPGRQSWEKDQVNPNEPCKGDRNRRPINGAIVIKHHFNSQGKNIER